LAPSAVAHETKIAVIRPLCRTALSSLFVSTSIIMRSVGNEIFVSAPYFRRCPFCLLIVAHCAVVLQYYLPYTQCTEYTLQLTDAYVLHSEEKYGTE